MHCSVLLIHVEMVWVKQSIGGTMIDGISIIGHAVWSISNRKCLGFPFCLWSLFCDLNAISIYDQSLRNGINDIIPCHDGRCLFMIDGISYHIRCVVVSMMEWWQSISSNIDKNDFMVHSVSKQCDAKNARGRYWEQSKVMMSTIWPNFVIKINPLKYQSVSVSLSN